MKSNKQNIKKLSRFVRVLPAELHPVKWTVKQKTRYEQ